MIVIGYVHIKTGFPNINGYRQLTDIQADIDTWETTFTIDGIFVDEVSNLWPDPTYDSSQMVVSLNDDIVSFI